MSEEIGLISSDKLCALAGLTERHLRRIAADGYFPPPNNGQWQTTATISGLLRYYRESSQGARAVRTQIEEEHLKELKLENERRAGTLIDRADYFSFVKRKIGELRERVENLPCGDKEKDEMLTGLAEVFTYDEKAV